MRRPPTAVRHVAAHRLSFAAVALTVLFTTVCAASAAAFASTVTGIAARRSLATDAGNTILVSSQVSAASARSADATVRSALRRAATGLPLNFTTSVQSPQLNLPASYLPQRRAGSREQALAQVISLPSLAHHASLVTGSWPAAASGGPVPVCLPAQPASQLHLAVGATLTLRDEPARTSVAVRVSCLFREDQPASPYWSLSPLGRSGIARTPGFTSYGPLVTTAAAMDSGRVPVGSAAWLAQPVFGALRAPNLTDLGSRIGAAATVLANSGALGGAIVTTRLPALLSNLATTLVVARSQLLIGVLILLVIAAATVTVMARLLVTHRAAEAALLAARGASRRQLASRGITDALLLAIPAAVAGPLIAARILPLLTRSGALAGAGLRVPPGQPAAAWLAGGAVAAGCGVIIALPWLRLRPSAIQQRVQQGRQATVGAVLSAGGDLALVVLAAAAVWQLAHFATPITTGIDGQVGADPILISAPVLALTAGALVTLRLLPLAARLGDRAAARTRGLSAAVAAWEISRKPLRQTGPALLATLAVASAVVALAEHSSWQQSALQQARFAVGADARVTLPSGGSLPLGQVADVAAAPGVQASTPAVRTQFGLPSGADATLLALDPRAATGVVAFDAGPGPGAARQFAALARSGPAPGALIPGRPARLRVTARLTATGMAAPAVLVELSDAAGIGYQVLAGSLPADGRPHELTASIAADRRADYPLRLTGFEIQYLQTGNRSRRGQLSIDAVRASSTRDGPFGAPFPAAPPGRGPSALAVTSGGSEFGSAISKARARVRGRRIVMTFVTNSTGGSPFATNFSVTAGPAGSVLPALATSHFLAASGSRLGHIATVLVEGMQIPVRLTGEISRFPTVSGPAGGIVVDQAALQDALRTRGVAPLPVTEWWLRTSGRPVLAGLPPGTALVTSSARARSLRAQPLAAAPLQALLAIAVAAILLACAGFVVSASTGRDRRRDVAMLDALGARPGQVAGLLCLEQAMAAVPAVLAGFVLGALLARLIVPDIILTAQAARPVPPVAVQLPWTLTIAIAAVIAIVPTLAAAISATHRIAVAALLRVEDET
jgi:hypothetical protein